MSYPIEGGCLCGKIRYRLAAPPAAVMHCHCDNCRKASGAVMLTWMTVREADFEWLQGEPRSYRYASPHYEPEIERLFCGDCGGQLVWHGRDDGNIDLTAGSLDDPGVLEPSYHVFTRRAAPWLHMEDGLPRYPTRKDG